MSSERFYLPKRLDDPPRFLLWSVDEAMVVILSLGLGLIMGWGIFTPIVTIILSKLWKRIKGSGGSNLIKAIIYWHYPRGILGLKSVPDSSIKKYIS